MDSFEINKLLGALLATAFLVFSVAIVSDSIFAAPVPENPGFIVEGAADDDPGNGGEPAVESILPLLATADPAAGQAVFKKCAACHTADNGGGNKAGPNLWDIVNRPVASHAGFGYSAGMKAFAEANKTWTYEHLDHFLLAPKAYVKGTAMGFGGVKKLDERANLVAYLRTLSDNPAPLPEVAPAAEGTPPAEDASADGTTPPAEDAAADGTTPPADNAGGAEATPPADAAPEEAAPADEAPAESAPAETAPAVTEPAETEPAPAQ